MFYIKTKSYNSNQKLILENIRNNVYEAFVIKPLGKFGKFDSSIDFGDLPINVVPTVLCTTEVVSFCDQL